MATPNQELVLHADKHDNLKIETCEMHTCGEPFRIVKTGYPEIKGSTILQKRRYCKEQLDSIRTFLMGEPRGHFDMYGAVLVKPDDSDANLAVLFIHNEGYSTMCGHGVIALGRYAIDYGLVENPTSPETPITIQCPCGDVKAFVEYKNGVTGAVRFHSVPAFVYARGVAVDIEGIGQIKVDVSFGGCFYAIVESHLIGLNLKTSSARDISARATMVSEAVRRTVTLKHPDNSDMSFLYGTIVIDREGAYSTNCCVFADRQVDRSPCGSGVMARVALQYAKGLINIGQQHQFESLTGGVFTASVVQEVTYHQYSAVIVQVSGKAHYTGSSKFTMENDDSLKHGFLLK